MVAVVESIEAKDQKWMGSTKALSFLDFVTITAVGCLIKNTNKRPERQAIKRLPG